MIDWLLEFFTGYPYLGVAVVFLACGLGLPLPEEIVLITSGYVCFKGFAALPVMMAVCGGAILAGDLIPFFLGHTFGSKLLRLRPLRVFVTKHRLMRFDRWFRNRGDLVIFIARFVAGLRTVAYFTAGTMRMSYVRFALLDGLGIAIVVPLFVFVGYRAGNYIDEAITWVKAAERGILLAIGALVFLLLVWRWVRRRRRAPLDGPAETFVGPSIEPVTRADSPSSPPEPPEGDGPDRG